MPPIPEGCVYRKNQCSGILERLLYHSVQHAVLQIQRTPHASAIGPRGCVRERWRDGAAVRKRYANDKDLMQADDHGSLPLDAQRNRRCVGVDSSNVVAHRGRGSSRSRHEQIVSSLPISTATAAAPPRSPHVREKERHAPMC